VSSQLENVHRVQISQILWIEMFVSLSYCNWEHIQKVNTQREIRCCQCAAKIDGESKFVRTEEHRRNTSFSQHFFYVSFTVKKFFHASQEFSEN